MPQMKAPAPPQPAPLAPAAAPPAPRAPSGPAAAIDSPFQINTSEDSARGPVASPSSGASTPQRRPHRRKDNTPIIIAIGGAVAMVLLGIGAAIVLTLPDDKSKVESKVETKAETKESLAARLVGKWSGVLEVDREALRKSGGREMTDEQVARMKMELDFRDDGTFDGSATGEAFVGSATGEAKMEGTWEVASLKGDTIELDMEYTITGNLDMDFGRISFTSKDRFVIDPPEDEEVKGMKLVFTRKK